MLYAKVASASASSTGNSAVTAGIDTTGADLLVAVVAYSVVGTFTSFADSKGNVWTPLPEYAQNNNRLRAYVSVPTSVGTSHTVTVTTTSAYPTVAFYAFSSGHQTNPFMTSIGASAASPGTLTPAENGALIIAGWGCNNTPTATGLDEAFTLDETEDATSQNLAVGWRVLASARAVTPTFTGGQTTDDLSALWVFRAADQNLTSELRPRPMSPQQRFTGRG